MMDAQLKEATLAVLHNNEIIMQQTEDINSQQGESNHTLMNMRKIYDGVRTKIEAGEELTMSDCHFIVIASDIAKASMERQARVVAKAIEMHEIINSIYTEAGSSEDMLEVLSRENPFDLITPAETEETEEIQEPNT